MWCFVPEGGGGAPPEKCDNRKSNAEERFLKVKRRRSSSFPSPCPLSAPSLCLTRPSPPLSASASPSPSPLSLCERCPQMAFGLLKAAESSSVCEPNHSMDLQAERARNGETDRARDGEYVTKKKRKKKSCQMRKRGAFVLPAARSPRLGIFVLQPRLIVAALTAPRVKMCIITS